MAVTAQIRARTGLDVEVMWGDEGFVVRFPDVETPPDPALLLPDADEIEGLVLRQLGGTSLFAARFRETAARALLLPRRRPGRRTPLWQQRKRAADLLAVAARFGSFPALLETYREILRDHFDMPALVDTLRRLENRSIKVATIDTKVPSPFASSLLFNYVANYIYDGDAPLAERRAQALSVDQRQLRELLGDAELRDLLDPDALQQIEQQLQHLDDKYKVKTADGLHDLLLRIGDLSPGEIQARSAMADTPAQVAVLEQARRVVLLPVAGEKRYVAIEDVARYRDALGVPVPPGVPESLLEPVRDPAGDLVRRYARSHGPFTAAEFAARYGLGVVVAEALLRRVTAEERLIEGEFRPGGTEREWIDADVLRSVRRRSLARLRQEVEPVDADALGRFAIAWHGVGSGRRGLEAVLDVVEQLQGAAIPASMLETEVLPARVSDYQPAMLDTLMAAGEVVWTGVAPLGPRDGRIALYLTDHVIRLRPPGTPSSDRTADARAGASPEPTGRAADVLSYLRERGASFFAEIHHGTGGGFPQETVDALWDLVWAGQIRNDTLHPLRAYVRAEEKKTHRRPRTQPFRSRRLMPRTAEGRWSVLESRKPSRAAMTEWSAALAQQLLTRHGIVTRETVAAEAIAGGFSAVYDVFKAMEEAGRVRRGYFVGGLGGAQFAAPPAVDMLRSFRDVPEEPRTVVLAATDPANPYGAMLKWDGDDRGPTRSVGARVVLVDGSAAGYLRRGERELLLFAPEAEPQRSRVVREVARALLELAAAREPGRQGMLIAEINGTPAGTHPTAHLFAREGFTTTAMGLQARITPRRAMDGIAIARQNHGGIPMADTPRTTPDSEGNTSRTEHDRIRSSNDRDQAAEREGIETEHNRGYDEAARGRANVEHEDLGDVDPDSAESEVDRDDTE
jgi:ATP-dependent Lhr-like helicase